MTRIMKIVPASRRVTEASLEPPSKPPSIDRSRAFMPAGRGVADGASIAATAENPLRCRKGAAIIGPINDSLRFGWMGLGVSQRRRGLEPGPITAGVHGCERSLLIVSSIGHGVWSRLKAGTTLRANPD